MGKNPPREIFVALQPIFKTRGTEDKRLEAAGLGDPLSTTGDGSVSRTALTTGLHDRTAAGETVSGTYAGKHTQ